MNRPISPRSTSYPTRSSRSPYTRSPSHTATNTRTKNPDAATKMPQMNAGYELVHQKPQKKTEAKPPVSNENANIQATAGKDQIVTTLKPPRYPKAKPAKKRQHIPPPTDQSNYARARLSEQRRQTRALNKRTATRPANKAPPRPRISRQRTQGRTLTARGCRSSRLLRSINQESPLRSSSGSRTPRKTADNERPATKSNSSRSLNTQRSYPGKHGANKENMIYKKRISHSCGVNPSPSPLVKRSKTCIRSADNNMHVPTYNNFELSRKDPQSYVGKYGDLSAFSLSKKHPLNCNGPQFPSRRTHHTHATHGNCRCSQCVHSSQSPDQGKLPLWEGIKGLFLNVARFLVTLEAMDHVER